MKRIESCRFVLSYFDALSSIAGHWGPPNPLYALLDLGTSAIWFGFKGNEEAPDVYCSCGHCGSLLENVERQGLYMIIFIACE